MLKTKKHAAGSKINKTHRGLNGVHHKDTLSGTSDLHELIIVMSTLSELVASFPETSTNYSIALGIRKQGYIKDIFNEALKNSNFMPQGVTGKMLSTWLSEMEHLFELRLGIEAALKRVIAKMHEVAKSESQVAAKIYKIIKANAELGDLSTTATLEKLAKYHTRKSSGERRTIAEGIEDAQGNLEVFTLKKSRKKQRVPKSPLFTIPKKDIKM